MDRDTKNPAADSTADGAQDASREAKQSEHTTGRSPGKPTLTVLLLDGRCVIVIGREAETLTLLIERGAGGLTSGEASPLGWARRTSAYIFKLRRLGLEISARRERTPDGARVARYRLETVLTVVGEGGEAKAKASEFCATDREDAKTE